jgi:hypothetical protein
MCLTGLSVCTFYNDTMCDENDIVKFCKLSRLRWEGHVIHQDDDDLARRVLLSEPGGKRLRGRPRLCWEDGVREDIAKLGCRNWTVVGLNREGWRKLIGATAQLGRGASGERENDTIHLPNCSMSWNHVVNERTGLWAV